jgi:hypothetical protein
MMTDRNPEPIDEALVRGIFVELCSAKRRKASQICPEPIGEASVRGILVRLCLARRRKSYGKKDQRVRRNTAGTYHQNR